MVAMVDTVLKIIIMKVKGGGGGGGGAGGTQFYHGYDGGYGGDGKDPGGEGGSGGSANKLAGANVILVAQEGMYLKEDAQIKVTGIPGGDGENGHDDNKGGGGGGGAGGAGGGRLTIATAELTQEEGSLLNANGGMGGTGGDSGHDNQGSTHNKGGGSGGGGAGGNPGEIIIYKYADTFGQSDINASLDGGMIGQMGASNSGGDTGQVGGKPASNDIVLRPVEDLKETKAGFEDKPEHLKYCSDGIDHDKDGYVDFYDKDCYALVTENKSVDADGPFGFSSYVDDIGISEEEMGISYFNPSALDGSDAVCGDDNGTCHSTQEPLQLSCSDFSSNKTECVLFGCDFEMVGVGGGVCKGSINISSLNKYECKHLSQKHNNSFVWSSDHGYVTPNGDKYFCNKDLKETSDAGSDSESQSGEQELTVNKDLAKWKWWNAEQHPYYIHQYDNVDFISNSQEWFYCNATTRDLPNQGRPMDDYLSTVNYSVFDRPSGSDILFTCTDVMNNLYENDFFEEEVTDFSGFTTSNGAFPCSDSEIDACCDSNPEYNDVEKFSWDSFYQDCLSECSINQKSIENDISQQNFCELYPFLSDCESTEQQDIQSISDRLEKDACSFDLNACLQDTIFLDKKCEEITPDEDGFEGKPCAQNPICPTGNYAVTEDVISGDIRSCCLLDPDAQAGYGSQEVCEPIDKNLNKKTCTEDYRGDWLNVSNPSEMRQYACSSHNNNSNCCVGGDWTPLFDTGKLAILTSQAQPEQFICYPYNGASKIAECCNSYSTCTNSQQDSLGNNGYGAFGKGGTLYTVENFDGYNDTTGEYIDYVRRETQIKDNFVLTQSISGSDYYYQPGDWSNFDTLHFDIGYNHNVITDLTIHNGSQTCTIKNLPQYFTNGNATMRWHHVRIADVKILCEEPIINDDQTVLSTDQLSTDGSSTQISTNSTSLEEGSSSSGSSAQGTSGSGSSTPLQQYITSDFWTGIEEIKVHIETSQTEVSMVADNIYLENNADDDVTNYYCAGDFGQWVENLDGPTDEGFQTDADPKEYGAQWYACESQASYDWTGRRCCGDDTESFNYDPTDQAPGEYFADVKAGCYGGVPVYNDMTVGEALLLDDGNIHHNLLYYEGKFHSCANSGNWFKDYDISYAPQTTPTKRAVGMGKQNTALFNSTNSTFTVLGTHVCSPDGLWVAKDEISTTRFIASKMYNLTFDEDGNQYSSYEITCDSLNRVTPYNSTQIEGAGLEELSTNHLNDFCTLRYKENQEEKMLVGLSFGDEPVEAFLYNMSGHASLVNAIEDEKRSQFSKLCNDIKPESTSSQEFFVECDAINSGASGPRLAYNPDFNILFFSMVEDEYIDFNGLFKQDDNSRIIAYVDHVWSRFISLFEGWFSSTTAKDFTNATQVRSDSALMPQFMNSSIDWTKLHISNEGDRHMQALVETRPTNNQGAMSTVYTVTYDNLRTSVKRIADEYTDYDELLEVGYMRGNESQVISIINPKPRYETFQPDFDVRRFTTALEMDSTITGSKITDQRGDGVVRIGELCDHDNQGNPVFKYGNANCSFWNESYAKGTVDCNSDGTLDYSDCS
ncbi:MAG: hypothetical protein ACOCU6_00420 [Nanoarchaeota archaeon]